MLCEYNGCTVVNTLHGTQSLTVSLSRRHCLPSLMNTMEVMLFLFMTECLGNWQPLVGIWKSKHHKEVYLAQKKIHDNFLRLKYKCYCGKNVVFLVNEQTGRLKMVADSLPLFPLRGRPSSLPWVHSGL